MVGSKLLSYLESEVFFPVLRVSPVQFRGKKQRLLMLQCEVIDILRDTYYCEALNQDVLRMLTVTLNSAEFVPLWKRMAEMGFKTPLDAKVRVEMLRCACADQADVDFSYHGGERGMEIAY